MILKCPSCNGSSRDEVFKLENITLSNLGLKESLNEALRAEILDFTIVKCLHCGLFYNKEFDPKKTDYSDDKNHTYFMNRNWLNFVKKSARNFKERYLTKDNYSICEIGCGKGEFLSEINLNKNFKCYGYDPSLPNEYESGYFHVIKDYFDPKQNKIKYDIIIIRHVLEHLLNAKEFVKDVIENQFKLGNKEIMFFIEVPNLSPTIKNLRFNDFVYEHVSYFDKITLNTFSNNLGLKVLSLKKVLKEENIQLIATIKYDDFLDLEDITKSKQKYFNRIENFFRKNNSNICFWGAGGRGVTLMNSINNYLDPNNIYVTDSDKNKHNRYLPICGYEIQPPEQINFENVSKIIITTELGKSGILKEIKELKLKIDIYILSDGDLVKCN